VTDSHYTPTKLADYLISRIKKNDVKKIADFCVGEGELLKAAQKKWSNAKFYGNDISSQVIQLLKRKYPKWILGRGDFLNLKSRNKTNIFKNKFDLILLNPPFTCKGSTIHNIIFDNIEYHVSTAMAFFIESINYLNSNGILYAILPQSIAYSQKDEKIREHLCKKYNFNIFKEINKQDFEKCSPNIILVAFNDKNISSNNKVFKQIDIGIKHLEVMRGKISMHKVKISKNNSIPLIHSTNIRNNKLEKLKYIINYNPSRIEGPAVLITRVGQPDIRKVCIIPHKKEYILSDCIIGLKTKTMVDCERLKKIIFDNWLVFSNLYKGTGAKYITINRIKYFFKL
jgi:tRNA1(Val) A37 N6-methylase TrmN6